MPRFLTLRGRPVHVVGLSYYDTATDLHLGTSRRQATATIDRLRAEGRI